ncbi:MAG: HTTM domain-containing protein [Fulvivirga sp.]
MNIKSKLFRPVDNSPLILFRMIFGLLLFLEAWGAIATGWVRKVFIDPSITFPFMDFWWLQPLPGYGMYAYYLVMGVAGIMVMLGFKYRWAMGLYALMWTGVYFMQKSNYNNHYYLLMILNYLMWLMPANEYYSLDAKNNPQIRSTTCPQWCHWVFIATMSIVYIYASVAKAYPDWLAAKPIGIWFNSKTDYWIIGPLLGKEWFQYFISWSGVVVDALFGLGLIWKRTRKYAFIGTIFFHLFNSAVFHIGIFPFLGIALGVFYFDPEVVRRIFFKKKPILDQLTLESNKYGISNLKVFLMALFLSIHILLPLRHWLFKGNVNWTEEGHRLSWRMMLRVKTGTVSFNIIDNNTNKKWVVKPSEYLTYKQASMVATRPDMLWQFVQMLKKDLGKKGHLNVSIYANSRVSLNGSRYKPLYDPDYDLAKAEWHLFKHAEWLRPFEDE